MINIYETVYNLSADPFRLSPDYRFAYSHPSYARAKAYLEYALLQGEGFVMITGAPGTGKTTLVRGILANIDIASVQVATLTSTQLRTRDLLQMVATAFGLHFTDADKATLLTALEQSLHQQYKSGRRAVLIVDEAQGLSVSALEELRLLANLQNDNQMLMQVFLLGQDKLRDLINSPGLKQLHQRVVASSHLEPLNLDDTVNYVQYRLDQAGWQGDPEIRGDALQLIHKYSGGVPRRINLICTRLFLAGGLSNRHTFDRKNVQDVILELQQEMLIDPDMAEAQEGEAGPVPRDLSVADNSLDSEQDGEGAPQGSIPEPENKVTPMTFPAASDSANDLRENKASPPVFKSKRRTKKKTKDQKQALSPAKESMIADELEKVKASSGEEQLPISLVRENKNAGTRRKRQPLTARSGSISRATAKAAHISELQKSVAKSSAENTKRKGRSWKKRLVVLLLVIGPLATIVGISSKDYVVTISAEVDRNGVIRGVIPDIQGP